MKCDDSTIEGLKINDIEKIEKRFQPFEIAILDGLQLAYKVTCNSLYGQVGAATSPICFKELAASTTAVGRKMVMTAKELTEEKYAPAKVVYGDTDSIFINFMPLIRKKYGDNLTKEEKLKYTIDLGLESGEYVTKHLKKPQDLEYEKVFYPFVIFTKKRYFGNKYETDVTKYKQTSMGIVTKRRDNPNIVKIIYSGVIDAILNKENIEAAKEYFIAEVVKLLAGNVDIKELVVSKSLKSRAKYKNPTTIAHQVLADRIDERDPGTGPQANDRVPYVYRDFDKIKCSHPGCNKKMNKKECKCRTCMKLFCPEHLKNHRKICKRICRFCKVKEGLKRCQTCLGYYCEECMIKHKTKEDKKGNITYDKCKKELQQKALQGDLLEDPKYAVENNVPLDYRYYLDHQIKTPVLQIFDLVMNDPESLIRDILIKNDNKKAGNSMITDFFTSS
jgi:DNA polymerase elongation subunit (family B)